MPSSVDPAGTRQVPQTVQQLLQGADGASFFLDMNRRIAVFLGARGNDWEELTGQPEFAAAYQYVADHLLDQDAFPGVVSAYCRYQEQCAASQQALPFPEWLRNRVTLLLSEWRKQQRSRQSNSQVWADQHVDQAVQPELTTVPQNQQPLLSALASLSSTQIAAIGLRIWLLDAIPAAWKELVLAAIHKTAACRGVTAETVEDQLQRLEQASESVKQLSDGTGKTPSQQIVELETVIALRHEQEIHWGRQKTSRYTEYVNHEQTDAASRSAAVQLLTADCRRTVELVNRADAGKHIIDEQIYTVMASGRRRIHNRQLWRRRDFCRCCHAQKNARQRWLKALAKLNQVGLPLLSYKEMAVILNCPEGTLESAYVRGRAAMLEELERAGHSTILNALSGDAAPAVQDADLNQYVCGNLGESL